MTIDEETIDGKTADDKAHEDDHRSNEYDELGAKVPEMDLPSQAKQAAGQTPISPMIGPRPSDVSASIWTAIERIHKVMGHPSPTVMEKFMVRWGASEEAVRAASKVQCSVCAAVVRPQGARAGRIPDLDHEPPEWNYRVMIDEFQVILSDGSPWILLGMLDRASRFFAVWPLRAAATGSATTKEISGAFAKGWMHWAKTPKYLACDPLKSHISEGMAEFVRREGMILDVGPTESDNYLAPLDAKIAQFKTIFVAIDREMSITKDDEPMVWISRITTGMNQLMRHSGWSPYAFVFGREPEVPTSLLAGGSLPALSAVVYDDVARRAEMIRQAALRATLNLEDMEAISRAVHARVRDPYLPQPGELMYFWKDAGTNRVGRILKRQTGWHGPAVCLAVYDASRVFALHAGGVIVVTPAQCRKASLHEKEILHWPSMVQNLRLQVQSRKQFWL